MSKSNATETDVLNKIFNATALPWDGVGNLTVHLHTDDPGEAGNSSTSEATYTDYAAQNVARTSGGWTVSGDTATNAAVISFPTCGATGNTITYVSISPQSSTQILYSGQLTAPLSVSNLVQPQFAIGALAITED
jgi:hypothetical protein